MPPSPIVSARLALAALLLAPLPLQAHFFEENPDCRAPVKPLEFVTELDKKAFEAKVAEYRSCLEAFVEKQNQAMTKHQNSAEKAAGRWKRYVENELGGTLSTPSQEAAPAQ